MLRVMRRWWHAGARADLSQAAVQGVAAVPAAVHAGHGGAPHSPDAGAPVPAACHDAGPAQCSLPSASGSPGCHGETGRCLTWRIRERADSGALPLPPGPLEVSLKGCL